MEPNDARRRIQQTIDRDHPQDFSGEGVKYGIPPARAVYAAPLEPSFLVDGNGATLELLSLLLTGDRAAGALLSTLNGGTPPSAQLPPGISVVLPNDMQVPSWEDTYAPDPFGRNNLSYWTARALEASYNMLGSAMGVLPAAACELGKDGKPGECCDATDEPFPSKPYYYVIPEGKGTADVVREFGRDENGWIELRRANADDQDGFTKQENGWCFWKAWVPGKRLRVPSSWSEDDYAPSIWPRLVDGNNRKYNRGDAEGSAILFMKGMPWRWRSPIHMMVECGRQFWIDPSVRPGLDVDPSIAKEIIKRTFLAKQRSNLPRKQPMPTILTDQTLPDFVRNNPLVVIRFHAPWCGHCKTFGPVFDKVAASMQGRGITFAEVNTDQQLGASAYFKVQGLPTTIVVKNGSYAPIDSVSGSMNQAQLVDWISKHIS